MKFEILEYRKDRTVYLSDEIDGDVANDVQRAIQIIIDEDYSIYNQNVQTISAMGDTFKDVFIKENKFPPITLYINCLGGGVYDGLGLYDYIRHINEDTEHHITVVCTGAVASMATIVMLGSDDRVATKNTSFLVHSLFDLMCGKIQDIEDGLAECKRLNEIMNSIYLKYTKLTKAKLKDIDKSKKDWWFGVDTALELGFINNVI